jgi:hypothetical protein
MSATNIDLIHRYLDALNDTESARLATFEDIFTPDCTFTDPGDEFRGPETVAKAIDGLRQQSPEDFRFSIAGEIDAHHEQARFSWQYGPSAREPVAVGTDFILFRDGYIQAVYGFFDTAASA